MRRLIVSFAIILTMLFFVAGYAVEFVVTVAAMTFDLSGPSTDSPFTWVWFGISLAILFGLSLLFCGLFARKIEKEVHPKEVFK